MSNKHVRLSSEQYIIDENNCITIPYSVIYNAGLGSDTEFMILEKHDDDNVYCIIPLNSSDYNKKEWEFVQKVECNKEEGMKIDVRGMFELKPEDSVSVDVYEFKLFLFDRVSVLKNNQEKKEEKRKETGGMKNFFDCFGFDPYAPDENSIQLMKENLDKNFQRLDKIRKNKQLQICNYNYILKGDSNLV